MALSYLLELTCLSLGDQRGHAGSGFARHSTGPCAAEEIEALGFGEVNHDTPIASRIPCNKRYPPVFGLGCKLSAKNNG